MEKMHLQVSVKKQEAVRRGFQAAVLLGASMAPSCAYFQNPFRQYAEPPPVTYPETVEFVPAPAPEIAEPKAVCPPKGPGMTHRSLASGIVRGVNVFDFRFDDCSEEGERKMQIATGVNVSIIEIEGQPVAELYGETRARLVESGAREPPRVSFPELLEMAKGRKAVVFGDLHTDTLDDALLKVMLPDLRSAGFDTLALEWWDSAQGLADAYIAGRSRKGALGELIAGLNKTTQGPAPLFMVEAIQAAAKNSLNVVFFDDKNFENLNLEEHAKRLGGAKAAMASITGPDRTKTLFQNLSRQIDEGRRLVVNTGFIHAVNTDSITMSVDESGFDDSIEAGPSLGYLLKRKYGDSQILITSLTGCLSSFLDVCVKGTPGADEIPVPLPGPRK
ncbi:hypothetical protein L0Y65_06765 [Candidatus Micrarchaeota archaeon]|nr:hypothetical protein [Candidatus Micrarchaeota archaeon]